MTRTPGADVMDGGRRPAEAVAAVARVAGALVGPRGLSGLGEDALAEIGDALVLEAAALYLPEDGDGAVQRRFALWTRDPSASVADTLELDADQARFLVRSGGPLVFREPLGWVLTNPFLPPAVDWLVLPLVTERDLAGVVVGRAARPISLEPVTATTVRSIAGLLAAGVATAALRAELQRMEIQRERLRLAADLHDGLAQDLALAVRELAFLATEPAVTAAVASRERLTRAVHDAHRIVRAGLEDLAAPLPAGGLGTVIEDVCERFRTRGLDVTLSLDLRRVTVAPAVVAVLLRVLHEALANVQRHSGSERAAVTVALIGSELELTVDDDGPGFDPETVPGSGDGHFGLGIMRQRAESVGGRLDITDRAPGTSVRLSVPIAAV